MRTNLALYLCARALGQSGHHLFLASLFIIAGTSDHASAGLSAVLAATMIGSVVFGIPGGALADRMGPGRGFALGTGLRVLAISLALFGSLPTLALAGVALSYSAASQLHNPSEMAIVKVLSGRGVSRLHSLLLAIEYGGQGLGFLILAPALYFLGGVQLAIAAAMTICLAQLTVSVVLAIRIRPIVVRERGKRQLPAGLHSRFAGMRETLSFFSQSEPARDAVAVQALKSLVAQVILVAFPLYLKHDLSLGTQGAAFLLGPGIAGAAVGLIWAATGMTLEGTARAMRLSILGMAIAAFALAALDFGMAFAFTYSQVPPLVRFEAALDTTVIVAMPVAFLIGATLSVSMVAARAALTAAAPLGIQSRVFALQGTAADAVVVLPLLFAGFAAELLGARAILGGLGLLCSVIGLLMWHPRFQLPFLARRAASRV